MSELPPFSHMSTAPRASGLRVVKPAPVSREDWRALAGAAAPATTQGDQFAMPTMKTDAPAMAHLRKRAAGSLVSVKPAAAHAPKTPVVREVESIGLIPGQEIDGYIER